jgi:hypothetical protein
LVRWYVELNVSRKKKMVYEWGVKSWGKVSSSKGCIIL